MHGMKRLAESLLREYLGLFPCVAILGPRQCGKTTLMRQLGADWRYFDLEKGGDLSVISHDPDLFLRLNPSRIALDEAQIVPALFPALRVAIDADRSTPGRFVITGSSSPALQKSISESLAGRIAMIELSPLMWSEVEGGTVSPLIRHIAAAETDPEGLLKDLAPRAPLSRAVDYWFRGGYPEPWLKNQPRFTERWTDQYIQTYVMRDVARLFPGLDSTRFQLFIRMLGGLSGRILNFADVARALGVTQPTARDYFAIAHGTFLWRTLPAFHRSALKRVVKHPRGHLRDTGLLHQLLRLPDSETLLRHPQCGSSWQGLVTEEILRQFSILGTAVEGYHYRTSAGAEVDLVCEGPFGLIPFEIKFGQRVDPRDLRPIRDFIQEYQCPLGFVINTDEQPRRYDDRLLGVPFHYL